jgi:uncharacterized membrane protein YkoI
MPPNTRTRKILVSVLAGLGIGAGAAGIANAVSKPTRAPAVKVAADATVNTPSVAASATASEAPDPNEATDSNEAPDTAAANDATDTAGSAADSGNPSYTASVTAPQGSANETDENAALAPLAKITAADATTAALAAVPGTAGPITLENENGNVVYGVTVTTPTGAVDVKVDAGNGKILAQDSGAEDSSSSEG